MFLSNLRQKLFGTRRKEIPLNLLSRLWIEKTISGKARLQNSAVSKWTQEDIRQFYSQHIAPHMAVLGPAAPVIDRILTLLDASGDCPYSSDNPDLEQMPSGISLREQSLTVAGIAMDMIKKAHRDYETILGQTLIICLGHGLGAVSPRNAIGGMPARTLLILDPMIQKLPFKQDLVLAILTSCEPNPKAEGAKILKAACLEAGKQAKERALIISKIGQTDILNPDVLDINNIRAAINLPEENRS
jgi:hypothetical protein